MGGGNASGVPPVPSDGAFGDSGNTVRVENEDDGALEDDAEDEDEEEEEEEYGHDC